MELGFRPSGLTQESFNNMVTGAGALYFGIDLSGVTASTTAREFASLLQEATRDNKALGATVGGITTALVPLKRQIEVDDLPAPIAASTVQDGWESATIATTIREITKENIDRVIATSFVDESTGAVMFGTRLLPKHFEQTLVWAAARIDGGILAFVLDGALNTEGFTVTSQSQNEGTIAVTFAGHLRDLADIERGVAPLRAYFFAADGADDGGTDGAAPVAAATAKAGKSDLPKMPEVRG